MIFMILAKIQTDEAYGKPFYGNKWEIVKDFSQENKIMLYFLVSIYVLRFVAVINEIQAFISKSTFP